MRRRQFLARLVSASLAGAGLTGCAREPPLRAGMIHWIGYEPLFLAEELGWLDPSVKLIRTSSGADTIFGLLSGTLDVGAMTLDEALRIAGQGVPLNVIAVMNVSAGADAVMVRPDMTALDALRGRRVAVELPSVSAIMMLEALEEAGLQRSEIIEIDLPVHQHANAWRQRDIDASVCFEPYASVLESLGARRLFDSRSMPESILDVLVVRRDRMGLKSGRLRLLLAAHFQGLMHLVRHFSDAMYRVATRQGVTPEAVRKALGTVTLPDLAANLRYLAPAGLVEQRAAGLHQLMREQALLDRPLNLKGLCMPAFLPRSLV